MGHEGIVQSRYKDSQGVWTIGIGHTKAAGSPNPEKFAGVLSMADVMKLFIKDVAKYERAVEAAVKVPLKQHQFDALVSWHYNTGAVASASLTKLLNAGKYADAGKGLMAWTANPELVERRTAEKNLFLHGVYPPPLVNIYPADVNGKVLWSKGKRVDASKLINGANSLPRANTKPTTATPAPAKKTGVSGSALAALAAFAAAAGVVAFKVLGG